jgi:hypothetical protein
MAFSRLNEAGDKWTKVSRPFQQHGFCEANNRLGRLPSQGLPKEWTRDGGQRQGSRPSY